METELLSQLFSVYDYLSDGVLICKYVEDKLQIVYANSATLSLFGFASLNEMKEFTGNNFAVLVHSEDKQRVHQKMGILSQQTVRQDHHLQYRVFTKTGKTVHIDDHGHFTSLPEIGEVIVDSITNVDDSITYSYETRDTLTGLFTMGRFINLCEDMIDESNRVSDIRKYNVVYINIHNFKPFNVEHGRVAGNQVLKFLADRIQYHSSSHVVSRIGSDHFVAITNANDMENRIAQLHDEFSIHYGSQGLTLKVGIYHAEQGDTDISVLCDFAKTACDSIRDTNNYIAYYDEKLKRKLEINNYVITHLDEAIENQYLKVYYQPVVRTLTNTVCGMEALIRWIDPVQGFLSPGEFIPALEDNLFITKLDLFVLRNVCEELVRRQEAGESVVPISFNLSRIDFLTCHIFEEVEEIVKSYRLPRDLIRIEITESTVMDNPESIHEIIQQFRNQGYEVWMDDFGSGYSSLNLLKNFSFDEMKLDMLFLRDFNNRSKNIIRSMVAMAKKLNIKTLAEGVETYEQYQFLKEIGCERVQGYYFSAPKPYDEIMEILSERDIPLEQRLYARYYDDAGRVDFMTDRALAMLEYDGQKYQYLYATQAYQTLIESSKDYSLDSSIQNINSPYTSIGRAIKVIQQGLTEKNNHKTYSYSREGEYYRLEMTLVSQVEGHCMNLVELVNITNHDNNEESDMLDKLNRRLYESFDAIYVRRLETGELIELVKNPYYVSDHFVDGGKTGVLDIEKIAQYHIHKDDQEAYLKFMDPSTKMERIQKSQRGHIVGYFRTKENSGGYTWKAHVEQYIPEDNVLLYTVSFAPIYQEGLMERAASDYINQHSEDNALWYSLMESKVLNLFWKDKNRRFLGVNGKFLDTYGIDDISQVIGKTDEDMHWHIDNEPFRSDEWDVLEKGITIENRSGKCLIKGVLHNIIASKEPIYRNGEIVGLLGYFMNVDDLTNNLENIHQITYTDHVTKLLSVQGMVNTVASYIETWKTQGDKFAIANISYGFYEQYNRTYGENITRRIMEELGKIYQVELVKLMQYHTAGARIYADNFILIATYKNPLEIEKLVKYLQNKSDSIHELAGVPVTLNPKIEIHYCENHSSEEMMSFATNTGEVSENIMHGALLVYRADESEEILYASSGLLQLLGCKTLTQFKRLTNNSFKDLVYPEDLERVEKEITTQIETSQDMLIDYVEYRVQNAQGEIFEVKDYGHLIETPTYGKAFYVILTKK